MAMSGDVTMDRGASITAKLLPAVWWILFPPFAILVTRFSFERGCQDPYELLHPIMQRQAGALLVAAVYVAAYAWVLAAGIVMLRRHDPALTIGDQLRAIWASRHWKVLAMAAALAMEQVPRAVWQWIYGVAGAC